MDGKPEEWKKLRSVILVNEHKEQSITRKWLYVVVIIVILFVCAFGGLVLTRNRAEKNIPQQNIYFLEYENDTEVQNTIVFKYDWINKEVVEIGRVKGFFYSCVINHDENCITGLLSQGPTDKEFEVAQYDLVGRTINIIKIEEKIRLLNKNMTGWRGALLYDEGNSILFSYNDKNEDEWWMFYDLVTEQYYATKGDKNGTEHFLTMQDDNLWYVTGETLYQYNLKTQMKTKIMDSVNSAAVASDFGLVAYTNDIHRKRIYLYDMRSEKTKCIAFGGWNIYYDDLFHIESQWSNDNRQLYYIKSFSGWFNAADISLMVYDADSGKSYCIYKVMNTIHEFRYVARM